MIYENGKFKRGEWEKGKHVKWYDDDGDDN